MYSMRGPSLEWTPAFNHPAVSAPLLVQTVPAHLLFGQGHNRKPGPFQDTPLPCYNRTVYQKHSPASSLQHWPQPHFTEPNTLVPPGGWPPAVGAIAGEGQLLLSSSLLTPANVSIRLQQEFSLCFPAGVQYCWLMVFKDKTLQRCGKIPEDCRAGLKRPSSDLQLGQRKTHCLSYYLLFSLVHWARRTSVFRSVMEASYRARLRFLPCVGRTKAQS